MGTTSSPAIAAVAFRPRRLAHGNFFVSNLERSTDFYVEVGGLTLVYREPGIGTNFLSNGSSHHDAALMEVSSAARIGRDGQVQVTAQRGRAPGLNHLGFEMEDEASLVAAYHRARQSGTRIHRTADHQISHSVYLFDPDGNYLEMYCDAASDWRSVYEANRDELLTGVWDPDQGEPSVVPRYDPDPRYSRVDEAILHPRRSSRATFVTGDLSRLRAYYTDVVGLDLLADDSRGRYAILAGANGTPDIALVQGQGGQEGLHHFGFELEDAAELDDAVARLRESTVEVVAAIDNATKRSVAIADPDGVILEFFVAGEEPLSRYEPSANEAIEFVL